VNGAKYFSIIDLSSSFWQVELSEDCLDFTAFLHNGKQYHFNRTPFGHNSSNAALLRALDNIFEDKINSFAASFVDDFCIFYSKFEDHLSHWNYVLGELSKHGLTVRPSNVHFCKKEVEFLSVIVSKSGIRPNLENVRQIRRFLGICQYQARFLISYAKEVQPLRELLKENK
jgi:Reverse transcriptase (RNA-dependent DNA polymerase).